jgi:signal transduction histidine kinase
LDNQSMDSPADPRWPKLVSLAVHEFRTPMTVVAGYIRMLLKDRAGPVSDQQRRLLEEAEKSCVRLSGLLAEMSDLGALEGGTAPFNRSSLDLRAVLRGAVAELPEMPDREITVDVSLPEGAARIQGDPVRLKTALTSLMHGLRRELVTSARLLVRETTRPHEGGAASWIVIGDEEHASVLQNAEPAALARFDEWRGGCGLSLAIARRVINAHGGALWSPSDGAKAAAVVMVPLQS